MIARRTFLKRASAAAVASAASGFSVGVSQAQQVPNSAGSEPAKLKAPRALATATTTSMTRSGFRPRSRAARSYRTPASRNTAGCSGGSEPAATSW